MAAPGWLIVKLLYIIDYFDNPHGGTELQFWRLLEGMRSRGNTVHLAVFRDTAYTADEVFPVPRFNLLIAKIFSFSAILKVFKLASWARRENIDVLHIFFNDASIICPFIFRCFGIPVIVSRRDMGFWINTIRRIPLILNARVVSRYIVNCSAVKEITSKLEFVRKNKIQIVYNGYESTDKDFVDDKFLSYKKTIEGKLVVGIVANYHPVKRLEDAIEAIAKIAHNFPELRFVVAGSGNREVYQRDVLFRELSDRVLFLGQVENSINYIKTFDVAILCSQSEGLSNSIIEYMKQGKPVIATAVGGNTDLVIHGETGLLVKVSAIDELASAFTDLLQDREKRESFGRNGKDFVDSKFSNEIMLDQHEEIYAELAGQ